jgi:hypothetical protein
LTRKFERAVLKRTVPAQGLRLPSSRLGRGGDLPYKRVIGKALRSRTDRRQAAEVTIAVRALNRMVERGHPGFVRIA